jgi:hypothetical protein
MGKLLTRHLSTPPFVVDPPSGAGVREEKTSMEIDEGSARPRTKRSSACCRLRFCNATTYDCLPFLRRRRYSRPFLITIAFESTRCSNHQHQQHELQRRRDRPGIPELADRGRRPGRRRREPQWQLQPSEPVRILGIVAVPSYEARSSSSILFLATLCFVFRTTK